MNLNKFTKAELISKLKKLDSKFSSGNNQSIFSILIGTIVKLKNFLIKLTLIAFLIKIFKIFFI
jgi:hypothetical protein